MVAGIGGSGETAGGVRSAVADGGRRCVPRACGAHVAPGERAEIKTSLPPCVPEKVVTYCSSMTELKYRGRVVTGEDILYIQELIAAHPRASRRRLSEKLCAAWQWKQANGALRDMVCRGLLLMLDRAGEIELPAVKFVPHNPF